VLTININRCLLFAFRFGASYVVMLLLMTVLQSALNTRAESWFLIQYMEFDSTIIYAVMITGAYYAGLRSYGKG